MTATWSQITGKELQILSLHLVGREIFRYDGE